MRFPTFLVICAMVTAISCRDGEYFSDLPDNLGKRANFSEDRKVLTEFDGSIIDDHRQLYRMSCIPSSVEMVLKLTGRVPSTYYDLQKEWKNKSDGSFRDFDGRVINGVRFQLQYMLPRNDSFPLEDLFSTIRSELNEGRFVIVSLTSGDNSWHNFVIYDEDLNEDFRAITKAGRKTITIKNVRSLITEMKGTDIGTYRIQGKTDQATASNKSAMDKPDPAAS